MKATKQLRELLREENCVVGAGCFDALSARIAEVVGFKALHITGFGMEATQLGSPDIGLITMTEILLHVGHITSAVNIPAICDAESGWGNVDNVTRAVREFERVGIAAIHLEDQITPKRCPNLEGRVILPRDEAVGKIQAACAARTDPDFVIVARSDADEISFDELVTRCNLYLKAGADLAMPLLIKIDGVRLQTLAPGEQLEWHKRICREVEGPLLGLGIPEGCNINDMIEAGYKSFILPTLSLQAAAGAMMAALKEAFVNGTAEQYFANHPSPMGMGVEFMNMLGLQRYLEIEQQFMPGAIRQPPAS
jgi:2-methylisocitrate lyase-like PEP mutase family enzyme